MESLIVDILASVGIDPDVRVSPRYDGRTAFEILEGVIMGALDDIEEGIELED